MYGKLFKSTFTGSMFGKGAVVFAVWGYAIANTSQDSLVELNPLMVAAAIGCKPDEVAAAIEFFCSPDKQSRTKSEDGRRLIREGEYLYRTVNYAAYNTLKNEPARREYNRLKQRESRARRSGQLFDGADSQTPSSDVSTDCSVSVPVSLSEEKDSRARAATGTRLPADWRPSSEDEKYARQQGLDPAKVAEEFRDYWHAVPGAKGRKADWAATWRTWCRRDSERKGAKDHGGRAKETAFDRSRRELLGGISQDTALLVGDARTVRPALDGKLRIGADAAVEPSAKQSDRRADQGGDRQADAKRGRTPPIAS